MSWDIVATRPAKSSGGSCWHLLEYIGAGIQRLAGSAPVSPYPSLANGGHTGAVMGVPHVTNPRAGLLLRPLSLGNRKVFVER